MINEQVLMEGMDKITEENITKSIIAKRGKIIENDFDELLSFIKEQFLYLDYICLMGYEKAKIFLNKIFSVYKITNCDIDEKLRYIIENGTRKLKRVSDYRTEEAFLFDNYRRISINKISANFKYESNWGNSTAVKEKTILCDQDSRVIWGTSSFDEPLIFIRQDGEMYAVEYWHKTLRLHIDIEIYNDNNIINKNLTGLDDIFIKYDEGKQCKINDIDLSDYFEKGFFYKGLKWHIKWPDPITVLKSITVQNDSYRIEIENTTYPHKGYLIFDLKDGFNVLEAGKLPQEG